MMTLILVTIFIAVSCTAAAGLIASLGNGAEADRPMADLAAEGAELASLVVSDRE